MSTAAAKISTVPPGKYLFERVGFHSARITELLNITQPEASTSRVRSPSLEVDDSSPKLYSTGGRRSESTLFDPLPAIGAPGFFMKHKTQRYTLYEGSRADEAPEVAKSLMEVEEEELFKTTSTYTETGGSNRTTRMYKDKGPGGDRWWSVQVFNNSRL
ncbi:hypothetical protein FRB99_000716 [Tulasnella sp. 403]|nr:hypothetical protein FRB99_000716 [Tulasnella sp. 403]